MPILYLGGKNLPLFNYGTGAIYCILGFLSLLLWRDHQIIACSLPSPHTLLQAWTPFLSSGSQCPGKWASALLKPECRRKLKAATGFSCKPTSTTPSSFPQDIWSYHLGVASLKLRSPCGASLSTLPLTLTSNQATGQGGWSKLGKSQCFHCPSKMTCSRMVTWSKPN